MKCYNCQYDKLDKSIKNCPICGVDVTNVCKSCQTVVPTTAKFCNNCGTKLTQKEEVRKDEILNIGVLFADISGFTSLAENYDSEETKNIINECFQAITKPIYQNNGSIDKYIGDCVMATFKSGSTKELCTNTLKAATKIRDALNDYLSINRPNLKTPLGISVGANFGPVVMGEIGSHSDKEYTVIGDTVNIASRLQTTALRGEVLVSNELVKHTTNIALLSDKQLLKVKNKKERVETYKVITLLNTQNSNEFYIDRDIDYTIKNYISSEKKNHILNIYGEPGIGKTTTIDHVLDHSDNTHQIKVVLNEWDKNTPYSAFVKIINQLLNSSIGENKRKLLNNYLHFIMNEYTEDEITRTHQFLSLILKEDRTEEYDTIFHSMNYSDLIKETKKQASLFIELLSIQEKLIVIDNGDYLDSETTDLFQEETKQSHIIVLSRSKLKENDTTVSIQMKPLPANKITAYMDNYFKTPIEANTKSKLVEIIDGNPLYLNEICEQISILKKTYKNGSLELDENVLKDLPNTINSLYIQRFESFDKTTQNILLLAVLIQSEIDFRFVYELLNLEYTKTVEETLEQKNIISVAGYYRLDSYTYKTYVFTNQSFRESIKNRLTKKAYKANHVLLASKLNERNEDLNMIAYHYLEAGLLKQAKHYYLKSASILKEEFNVVKSVKNYLKYISIESDLERTAIEPQVVESYIELANLMIYKGDFVEAINYITLGLDLHQTKQEEDTLKIALLESYKGTSNIEKALPLVEELATTLSKSSENYGRLLKIQSTIYNMIGKPGVIELVDQSRMILEKTKDYENLSEALAQAGIRNFIEGNIQKGIESLESAIVYSNKAKNKSLTAKIMINLGILYNNFGEEEKSNTLLINAMKIAKEISNNNSYVTAAINLGVSYLKKGEFNNALKTFEESLKRSNSLIYQKCITLTNLGDVYYELGAFDLAKDSYNEGLEMAKMMKLPIEEAINNIGLTKTRIITKQLIDEETIMNKHIKELLEAKEFEYVAISYFVLSDYFIETKDIKKAESAILKSLDYAKKSNSKIEYVKALRKQLEISLINNQNIEEQFKEFITEATSNNFYYELTKAYYTRYLHTLDNKYLKQAEELLIYFDDCYLSKQIKN